MNRWHQCKKAKLNWIGASKVSRAEAEQEEGEAEWQKCSNEKENIPLSMKITYFLKIGLYERLRSSVPFY